ncbi:hypothetical protein BD560DRAFT_109960 [Blakeslea trispora]|nr:hypothetical protein BD560DRAFT_109960 [Blakeslea trispora]
MNCVLRTFRCHVCQEDKTNRTTLYNHIKKHEISNLPPQLPVVKNATRGSNFYQFISINTIRKQPNLHYSLIFVCAICNNLHSCIDSLRTHFNTHLNITSASSTSLISSSSADTNYLSPTTSENSLSPVAGVAVTNKHPSDSILESSKVCI